MASVTGGSGMKAMLHLRKADDRGPTNLGWLDSRHTFSFGHYYDPRFSGFHDLLVINEDRVAPGAGFPPHPHGDMEILSYVVAGALEHRDSLGNGSVIRPGELQRMSAGTGIRHSEHNASKTEPVHFLQIWITPERNGIEPSYEQKRLPPPDGTSRLDLIGSRDGRGGSVTIHQDVDLYRATVRAGDTLSLDIRDGRGRLGTGRGRPGNGERDLGFARRRVGLDQRRRGARHGRGGC